MFFGYIGFIPARCLFLWLIRSTRNPNVVSFTRRDMTRENAHFRMKICKINSSRNKSYDNYSDIINTKDL